MRLDEAREWLRGERSEANFYRSEAHVEPYEREVALARADAAMTEQAYWIVRAQVEGLLDVAGDDRPVGENVVVPRRFLDEISLALHAATVIGARECVGLNYGDQDRLMREADRLRSVAGDDGKDG